MEHTSRTLRLLLYGVLILGFACIAVYAPEDKKGVRVYMLDVGQGDSFLIEAQNGKQILIDGGRDMKVLSELAAVLPRGDRSIDVVIATHPDADHIGGLAAVLSRYKVGLFITAEVFTDTAEYRALLDAVDREGIPAYYARRGMELVLDTDLSTTLTILFPDRSTYNWNTNTASVVSRLAVGAVSMLFTGDTPSSIEQFLSLTNKDAMNVEVLQLPHHGSKTSSSSALLKATTPNLALISVGKDNTYGHPAKEVMMRLESLRIPFLSTAQEGRVMLVSDGNDWQRK